jgi:hypothetical protein
MIFLYIIGETPYSFVSANDGWSEILFRDIENWKLYNRRLLYKCWFDLRHDFIVNTSLLYARSRYTYKIKCSI